MDINDKLKKLLDSKYKDILGQEKGTGQQKTPTLREKLEQIYRRNQQPAEKRKPSLLKYYPVENLIEGEYKNTPLGDCFVVEELYPFSYHHGDFHLGSLLDLELKGFKRLIGEMSEVEIDPRSCLFIDTETSGLVMGTGTYVFLIGAGFYSEEGFRLYQFFIREYAEEPAMLYLISSLLERFDWIVSFNGKRFDVPLLRTRFILNQIHCQIDALGHLDLLFPSRRLWNLRLENCRLVTLERELFQVIRTGDVPGEDIPRLYFEFLKTGNARLISPIFYHNAQDILSLTALLGRIAVSIEEPFQCGIERGEDFFSLGRVHHQLGDMSRAVDCYEEALKLSMSEMLSFQAMRELSLVNKKAGIWQQAVQRWEKMIAEAGSFDPFPYEELAKYWEHQEHDYQKAIEIIERALQQIEENRYDMNASEWLVLKNSFQHRHHRLTCKAQGKKWY
jgi:uncharacterized protein YprB with RNaseH-like and TPR domain